LVPEGGKGVRDVVGNIGCEEGDGNIDDVEDGNTEDSSLVTGKFTGEKGV